MSALMNVLERASAALRTQMCGEGELASELDDASAAVAELVEAVKAERSTEQGSYEWQFAADRVAAALSHIGGAA